MDAPGFHIITTVQREVLVLRPAGWLNFANCAELERILDAADKAGHRRVVIDLSASQFLDQMVMSSLVLWKGRLEDRGGRLVLATPSRPAMSALRAGGLHNYLPVGSSLSEALVLARRRISSGRLQSVARN